MLHEVEINPRYPPCPTGRVPTQVRRAAGGTSVHLQTGGRTSGVVRRPRQILLQNASSAQSKCYIGPQTVDDGQHAHRSEFRELQIMKMVLPSVIHPLI